MSGKRNICSVCETGRRYYELDPLSVECPYMIMNDGRHCMHFVKLDKRKKSLIEKLWERFRKK